MIALHFRGGGRQQHETQKTESKKQETTVCRQTRFCRGGEVPRFCGRFATENFSVTRKAQKWQF
eukprot:scaffold353_cov185-Amphora_coffeaeformis.AAC.6